MEIPFFIYNLIWKSEWMSSTRQNGQILWRRQCGDVTELFLSSLRCLRLISQARVFPSSSDPGNQKKRRKKLANIALIQSETIAGMRLKIRRGVQAWNWSERERESRLTCYHERVPGSAGAEELAEGLGEAEVVGDPVVAVAVEDRLVVVEHHHHHRLRCLRHCSSSPGITCRSHSVPSPASPEN